MLHRRTFLHRHHTRHCQAPNSVQPQSCRPQLLQRRGRTMLSQIIPCRRLNNWPVFHAFPVKGSFVPPSDFLRVNGQFIGTTDQILRWGA